MEYIVHLNDIHFIDDFKMIGINHFVVGCQVFSYRQSLSLDYTMLEQCKQLLGDRKLYVLVNAMVDESMIATLEMHLEQLAALNIDGLFFQDFAVLQICKEKKYNFSLYYTPDTLNTNYATINYLNYYGVDGVMLAREISLEQKNQIQNKCQCDVIVQGHGVEYMASSKRKLLTNYLKKHDKQLDCDYAKKLHIKANGVDDSCYIYEDQYATHIVSKVQLCSLDVLDKMHGFNFVFLESLYLDSNHYFDVVKNYVEGLDLVLQNDKSKLEQLYNTFIERSQYSYYHSFLFDETVYKIKDVRIREGKEVL